MYNLLVILIVVVAIAYIIRTFYKRLKKKEVGCCGCSSCDTDPLAVGTPVTQRPPHSPGRAVFPHPVPRLYSLSRKALAS